MSDRKILITVETPFAATQTVVLHEQTWDIHIPQNRRDLGINILEKTLQDPCLIVAGTSNPNYVVFINNNFKSQNSASPLVVIVDPDSNPTPAVASFGHRKDFRNISEHRTLWVPPPKDNEN